MHRCANSPRPDAKRCSAKWRQRGKTDRAQLCRLLDQLETGDVVTVTRLDRLARSTRDLEAAITGKKAGFRSLGDTWADTTTSNGRLMLTVSRAGLLHRQAGLGAVERLDLALLVDRQHQAMRRRVEIEPDHVAQFGSNGGIVRQRETPNPVRLQTMGGANCCTERSEMPLAAAIARPVQWVASPGGSASVSSTTRSTAAAGNGGSPGLRSPAS